MPGKKRLNAKQQLAQALAYHCVRNTRLEDIHANDRISDEEMKDLMIEVTNSIYTALVHPEFLSRPVPPYWNAPKILNSWKRLLTMVSNQSTNSST